MATEIDSCQGKMSQDELLLEGEFEVFPNEKILHKVELTRSGITYFPLNTPKTKKTVKYLHFGDVIGCRCRKSVDQKHLNKAYITVFAYPLKKKLFSDKWIRHKFHVTFARTCDSSFDANRRVVEKWRRIILHLCQRLPVRKKDVEKCPVPAKRRLLVLVNPHSGPGKAMQIYQKQVAPMLDEADIQVKVIETDHAGHGMEMMKSINRREYYGVVIVSGDGLIYEVINGLMSRDDWQDAVKIPVGCIPGGSGNALSCSINYSAGESVENDIVLHSTFILIKHRVVPMDLVLIEQPHARLYSFLSISWGLFADIDYESEKFRALGEARFTVQAIRRILSLRKYRGKLSFLPITEYIPKSSINNNTDKVIDIPSKNRRVSLQSLDNPGATEGGFEERFRTKSMPSSLFKSSMRQSDSEDFEAERELADIRDSKASGDSGSQPTSPTADNNDVQFSLSTDNQNSSSINGKISHSDSVNSVSSLQEVIKMTKQPGEACPNGLLPPLDQPVPSGWVTLEEEFVNVNASYQTHLGSDIIMAPDARFSDGIIHLSFIRAGIQKTDLMTLMTSMDKGTIQDYPSPNIEFVKVLAFRLEPEDGLGIIMVDGEKVDCTPLQAQVLPGLANVMAIQ